MAQSETNCPKCGRRRTSLRSRIVYHGPIVEMEGQEYCRPDCLLDEFEKHRCRS